MGLVSAVGAAGISLSPVLLERLVSAHGWRAVWAGEGLLVWATGCAADGGRPVAEHAAASAVLVNGSDTFVVAIDGRRVGTNTLFNDRRNIRRQHTLEPGDRTLLVRGASDHNPFAPGRERQAAFRHRFAAGERYGFVSQRLALTNATWRVQLVPIDRDGRVTGQPIDPLPAAEARPLFDVVFRRPAREGRFD